MDTTAVYLAKRLCAERGYRPGTAPEAQALADAADIVLTKSDGLTFQIVCIVDREAHPARRFPLGLDAVIAGAAGCLAYTGTMNGTKLPVGVQIWEVGPDAAAPAEWERLRQLSHRMPGGKKVLVSAWAVDSERRTVTTSLVFNGLLGGRPRLERLLRQPRKADDDVREPAAVREHQGPPVVTLALLAVLALVFVAELLFGVRPTTGFLSPHIDTLVAAGGLHAEEVQAGEWYRFVSAVFLHGGALHLLMNGVALFLAGYVLEALLGRAWLLALFTLGGLGGTALSYVLNPPTVVSVGASGAICGLLAAALASSFRLPEGADRMNIQMRLGQILVPALLPLFIGRTSGHVDYGAHLGGALVGTALGLLLMRRWPRTDPLPPWRTPVRAVAALGGAAALAAAVLVPKNFAHHREVALANASIEDALAPQAPLEAANKSRSLADATALAAQYPHDPRTRLVKALAHMRTGDGAAAQQELRSALAEEAVLKTAFPDGAVEGSLRGMLAALLLDEGKTAEARAVAAPACASGGITDPMLKQAACD